jgi:hypothetical protein
MYQVWRKNLITKDKEIVTSCEDRVEAVDRLNKLNWEDVYQEYSYWLETDKGEE